MMMLTTKTSWFVMKKRGIEIVRDMVRNKVISQYRLAKEMGVTENAVRDWVSGRYFDEYKHLPKLLEVREKYMRAQNMGIWS